VVDDEGAVLPDSRDVAAVRTAFGRLKTVADSCPRPTRPRASRSSATGGRCTCATGPWRTDAARRGAGTGDPVRRRDAARRVGGARWPEPRGLRDHGHAEGVRALVEFLTDARSQQQLFQRGGLPATRKIVYKDPAVQSDFTTTLVDALDGARTRPVVPHYAAFSRAFRAEVDAYVRRGQQVRDEDIRARLEAALQGREPPQPS
jgi:hypothetical protein